MSGGGLVRVDADVPYGCRRNVDHALTLDQQPAPNGSVATWRKGRIQGGGEARPLWEPRDP